jgi:hypothetical protein
MSCVSIVEIIAGAEAGDGCSGVAHVSKGNRCGESSNIEGGSHVGKGTGGGVGGGNDRARKGDVLER